MYEPPKVPVVSRDNRAAMPVRTRGICSSSLPLGPVRIGNRPRWVASAVFLAASLPRLWASGETNLEETNALVWIMVAISTAGAIVTFAFLVYSLWKFRDPKVKDRRYG